MRHEGGLENCLKAAIKSREATCFTCRPSAVEPWETKQTALRGLQGLQLHQWKDRSPLRQEKGKYMQVILEE